MTARNAASRSRGAAARSELNGKLKTITFRGVKLNLPSKAPFRLMYHFKAGLEMSADDLVQALDTVLGDQMEKVWAIELDLKKEGGVRGLAALLNELAGEVFDAYDLTPGE